MDWVTGVKIPVGMARRRGRLADRARRLVLRRARRSRSRAIAAILWALQAPPPLVIVAIFAAIAWFLQRSWWTVALVVLGFLFVLNQGYWEETTETLTLVLSAVVVCMGLGVPIGIAAAHRPRLFQALRPILDLMQTLPTFVYLIPAIVFFGIGMVPGLIATAIFVIPAPIRLTHLGIVSTPKELKEAGVAFGATPSQLLRKVELPWALPQIMVGLTQTIMLSLSMVVIAALVGADGLGVPVVSALNTSIPRSASRPGWSSSWSRSCSTAPSGGGTDRMTAMIEFDDVASSSAPTRPGAAADGPGPDPRARSRSPPGSPRRARLLADRAQGEISVLMGLSGSGKSTLLRAVNGLNPVTRGDCWCAARGRDGRRRHLRRRRPARAAPRGGRRWSSSSSRCCPGARW